MPISELLIEFRILGHLEFLLKAFIIIKLPTWKHTIVCGNENYEFIKNLCNNILVDRINIIKLNINNIAPSSYSELLTQENFWNNFTGERLLIYQEDAILYHNNLNLFMNYDYIGAPWPREQNDNEKGVGNGGFSLRTKSKLLECIKKIKPNDLTLGTSTIQYIKNTKSTYVPEDVYFSKTMIDYKIGKVATWETAKEFSQETQYSLNPVGGHCWWLYYLRNTKEKKYFFELNF